MKILKRMQRLYVAPDALDATVSFYEIIQHAECEMRLRLDAIGIEVAVVNGVILLAGNETALAPVRDAQVAFVVDSLDSAFREVHGAGAEILHEPCDAIGGRNFTARHPDGLVVEYYEPELKLSAE
ncbi:glyoxalase [Cupriavidus sp. 2SB]|uniref:VOC family protein n=1 Tax=Cupriavidus sp. 2SB TaxID=2502199 RepID=UPI0010FA5A05|nr:glyoxalase [Cupriavidus sp. 2SB]